MPHHWHSDTSSANWLQYPEETVPTYQYVCTACGHQLEAVQSFTDEPLTECPSCEGRLRKVFNSVGIVFKGSGFYRTDSRNGAGSDSSTSSTSAKSATSNGGSGSSNGSSGDSGKSGGDKSTSTSTTTAASASSGSGSGGGAKSTSTAA